MELERMAPLLLVFFVWGLKPGPHTIALMMRSISHNTRSGLAMAIGNNAVHVMLFLFFAMTVNALWSHSSVLGVLQFAGGIYIIWYCAREIIKINDDSTDISERINYGAHALSGVVVGISNPLNLSFYAAIVPELGKYHFSGAELGVISFLIFFALLSGQSFYIAFSDVVNQYFSLERSRRTIMFVSNFIFILVGVAVSVRALTTML